MRINKSGRERANNSARRVCVQRTMTQQKTESRDHGEQESVENYESSKKSHAKRRQKSRAALSRNSSRGSPCLRNTQQCERAAL